MNFGATWYSIYRAVDGKLNVATIGCVLIVTLQGLLYSFFNSVHSIHERPVCYPASIFENAIQ